MFRSKRLSLPALTLLLAGTAALSQTSTGALTGRITDVSGRALEKARVTFESSSLFQPRVVTTDGRGEFRAMLLPVGNYTVIVDAPGYLGKSARNVRVGLGATLSLDFALTPIKTEGATVEIVGNQTQEAKTADKVSYNYSATQLLQLPTARSFDGAMALAPGVSGSGMGLSIRGGSAGSDAGAKGGGGYSQVLYRIDGIDVKDDSGTQWDQTNRATLYEPLPDSIEDVQVVLSALNARYGRTQGGQVNILTRSGSNEWSGSLRATLNRPSWTTDLSKGPVDGDLTQRERHATEGFSRFMDFTASGPIIKDRLWFYVGTRFQPNQSGTTRLGWPGHVVGDEHTSLADVVRYPLTTLGNYGDLDHALTNAAGLPAGYQFMDLNNPALSDYGKVVPHDIKYQKLEGKLTGMVNANHTLSLTFLSDKTTTTGMSGERSTGQFSIDRAFMGDQVDTTRAFSLGWNGNFGDAWFVEARAFKATFEQGDVLGPTTKPVFVQSMLGTGSRDILVADTTWSNTDNGQAAFYGPIFNQRSSGATTANKRGNSSFTINIKTFRQAAGQHEIDFGAEAYQSVHAFGRDRNENRGIFNGGFIINPSTRELLYPVFYTAHESEGLLSADDRANRDFVQWGDYPLRGPGAHMERYWATGKESKNLSTALWVNDTWTVSDRLNVMAGLRYNRFVIKDTDGREQANSAILEPRFQVKLNPDGIGKDVFTFSAAKLSSAFSDEMASNFRGNGWYVRTIHGWKGLPGQPGVDDPAAATDMVNGQNMHGLRWVTYDQLINMANYGAPILLLDNRVTYKTAGLKTPYALEFTAGFQRNFEGGFAKVDLIQRRYRKEWVSYVKKGYGFDEENYSLVQDPSGLGPAQWQQNNHFINSDLEKVYTGVEVVWQHTITPRLTFGGNYTYSQLTGRDATDYYNYRAEKLAEGIPESVFAPEGVLARSQVVKAHLTYVHPVGKGNVSASILANYWTGGTRSLFGIGSLQDMVLPGDDGKGHVIQPLDTYANNYQTIYRTYYGAPGAFKGGSDVLSVDMRLQATFPLAGKVQLTTYVQISNLFNRIQRTGQYDWGTASEFERGNGYDEPIPGRPLPNFHKAWGFSGDSTYHTAGRTFTQFSVGLKF